MNDRALKKTEAEQTFQHGVVVEGFDRDPDIDDEPGRQTQPEPKARNRIGTQRRLADLDFESESDRRREGGRPRRAKQSGRPHFMGAKHAPDENEEAGARSGRRACERVARRRTRLALDGRPTISIE